MENRGSEWRKWDLHLHTPGTAINDKFKLENNTNEDELWKDYCKRINSSGVSVVGITDYGSVDNYILLKENRDNFELNKEIGTTLVLVTHDVQLAEQCQKHYELLNGQLVDRTQGA